MTNKNGKESFVMYGSFLKAAEPLNGDDFKECVLKLRDYALYGEDLSSDNQLVNTILIMAKPNLKAAADRYQRCVENGTKGKEFGKKGGRPRKGETRADYQDRRGLETPRKPLNDNEDENIDDDEKETVNEKDNCVMSAPSGQGTLEVPTPLLVSSSVSIESSNHSKGIADASNAVDAEDERTSNLNSPASSYNSAEADTNETYIQEIRGYLLMMAKYALGIINLEDFDDIFERAIQSYMNFKGVSKPKAAKAIEQLISEYKEGIQNRIEAEKRSQEVLRQEVEESDEPF